MQRSFIRVHSGDLIVALMMICFALLGVTLVLHALDLEMTVFGISLTCFAGLFLLGQIRRQLTAPAHQTAMEQRHG